MATAPFTQNPKYTSATNNNATTTLPANRVVGWAGAGLVDLLSVAAKIAGVTKHGMPVAPALGSTNDLGIDGVVPIESTGAAIAVGDKLTPDGTLGRVLTAAPATGVNAEIVGVAETAVAGGSPAGTLVMARLRRFTMQGA